MGASGQITIARNQILSVTVFFKKEIYYGNWHVGCGDKVLTLMRTNFTWYFLCRKYIDITQDLGSILCLSFRAS